MSNTIKIASINISGIQSLERRRLLLDLCLEGDFDLVGLQEVAFHECPILESRFHFISNIGPHKRGTAVLIRRGISFSRELLEPDGRLVSVDVGTFTFVCISAPSGRLAREERNDFLRLTIPAYASTSRLNLILLGDFNCVDDITDRSQPNIPTCPSRLINKPLTELTSGLELVDIWKKLKPSDRGHTFHHPNGSSRIDRVYTSREFSVNFTTVSLRPLSISDHFSIECSLSCDLLPPSRSRVNNLWKFNTAVLAEEAFQREIHDFVATSSKHPLRESSVADWWETVFKVGVKRISIRYCTRRARLIRETKLFYQNCIRDIVSAEPLDWEAYKEL